MSTLTSHRLPYPNGTVIVREDGEKDLNGNPILAASPLMHQQMTMPYRLVLRLMGEQLVVHAEVFHEDGTRSYNYGSYFRIEELPKAMHRFQERFAKEIYYAEHLAQCPAVDKPKIRTQEQVDALWGDNQFFHFKAVVQVAGVTEIPKAAHVMQELLYDEWVGGDFRIQESLGDGQFKVTFQRNVCDEVDVSNPALLAGKDFSTVLTQQLMTEVVEAVGSVDAVVKIVSIEPPVFTKESVTD